MSGQTLPTATVLTEMKTLLDAASLGVPVFKDAIVNNLDFPYIHIAKPIGSFISDKDTFGTKQIYRINIWSKAPDGVELDTLTSGALEALTDGSFTVAGFNFIQILYDSEVPIWDAEEDAYGTALSMMVDIYGNNRP